MVATNRRARHDYLILDTYEAGISLTGTEVKSLREGRASLVDGYAEVENGEVWLRNAYIPEYLQGSWTNHATRRKRKLLLHKQEITRLSSKSDASGVTIIPLRLYFKGSHAKVEIAIARGKRDYDKRQTLRKRQDEMEAKRAMSRVNRRGGVI